MVWKFPSKITETQGGGAMLSETVTNEKLQQITKRLCQSVYQNDYLGFPQGNYINRCGMCWAPYRHTTWDPVLAKTRCL